MPSRSNPAGARFDHGADVAQSSAKVQLEFIMANLGRLDPVKDAKRITAARDFSKQTARFTPNQLSYIDGIYECVMKACGMPSVGLHAGKRQKGLRFG